MQNAMYIEIPQDLTSYEFFNNVIAQTGEFHETLV